MNEVCRQEKKYWMNLTEMKRLADALAPIMLQDKLNGIEMRRKLRL